MKGHPSDYLTLALLLSGVVFVFFSHELAMMCFSFPAGRSGGIAYKEIKHAYRRFDNGGDR